MVTPSWLARPTYRAIDSNFRKGRRALYSMQPAMACLWGQVMNRQIDLVPLKAYTPTIVELSDTDWLAAVAFASMRRALNDGDRGPQRDMGQDINQRGDETGLIGEIVGLRVAEKVYVHQRIRYSTTC